LGLKNLGEKKPRKPFQTAKLNLYLNRWAAFCSKENVKAEFYGKSLTLKNCTENGISLPVQYMLAQLLCA
jgi:hypothetical protein